MKKQIENIRLLELQLAYEADGQRETALGDLIEFYLGRFTRIACRLAYEWNLLNPVGDAQDSIQDAALSALERIQTFDPSKGKSNEIFCRWFTQIIVQKLRAIRDRQVRGILEDLGLERVIRILTSESPDPERNVIGKSAFRSLLRHVGTPQKARLLEARLMRNQDKMTWSEIVRALNWQGSKGGLRASTSRLASQLKEQLDE